MIRSCVFAMLAAVAAAVAWAGAARADGVALVRVEPPHRGSVALTVTAYGAAAPSTQSATSLTLPQAGQVTAVLVTPGQAVRRGQTVLSFAVAPSALSSYRQAQGALTLARAQRLHAAQLLAQQLGTRDQLAAADKAVTDAQVQLTALSREGAGQASVSLRAPFDGLVATVPIAAGDRPAAGAALVTLNRGSGLHVPLGVEPGLRGRERVGQPVRLQPLGGGAPVQGRVVRVDAVLNPRSRLVVVDVSAPAGQALSGQVFQGRIAVGVVQGWTVPHAAVRVEAGRAFVFQVAGGRAHRVEVQVAQAGREVDVVQGALDPARPLVGVGAYQLDDGDPVRTR